MPLKRQVTSDHERVMHRLMGSNPNGFSTKRTLQIMRRNMSRREAEQANQLYVSLGWEERWRMEPRDGPCDSCDPSFTCYSKSRLCRKPC